MRRTIVKSLSETDNDLSAYLASRATEIEKQLDILVPQSNAPHKQLFAAARYSLLNGGKRIRPILVLAVCEMLRGNYEKALRPAAAIEMIHTYSLIHDDLPCMDNDDFRRGKPTLHKAFPEAHALLAGDFLLTHAFFVLAHDPDLDAVLKVRLMGLLSEAAGGNGMIGGQVQDIEAGHHAMTKETLDDLHRAKTGALIEVSVGFGALLGGASEEEYALLQRWARSIGLAFQIVDDIIDVTASEEKHGKKTASDAINGKETYATLLGIENAQNEAQKLHEEANLLLKQLPYDTQTLESIADYLVHRRI